MPNPADFKDKDSFLATCIPMVTGEGKSQDQAVAECENMWASHILMMKAEGEDAAHVREEPEAPRTRLASIERGTIDMKTGIFPMVLATDGEASDGDILHIAGARFGDRVPLQNSHQNDTKETLGSVTGFRRDNQSSPKKLRAMGQIELGGPASEVRQDLAYMVEQGHIHAVSVRWQPIQMQARTSLPADHYAYIDGNTEKDPRKRYGTFHSQWQVLEGSIVAVPADREAIIGRADATSGTVSTFWRGIAAGIEEPPPVKTLREFERPQVEMPVALLPAQPAKPAKPSKITPEARLAALGAELRELTSVHGLSIEEIEAEVTRLRPGEPTLASLFEQIQAQSQELTALRESLAAALSQTKAEPTAPPTPEPTLRESLVAAMSDEPAGPRVPPMRTLPAIFEVFESMMRESQARLDALVGSTLNARKRRTTLDLGNPTSLADEVHALVQGVCGVADPMKPIIEQFEARIAKAKEKLVADVA